MGGSYVPQSGELHSFWTLYKGVLHNSISGFLYWKICHGIVSFRRIF